MIIIIIQKEFEKKDKYLDLARELKKLRNMQVTVIPIVVGAFRTVTNNNSNDNNNNYSTSKRQMWSPSKQQHY